MQAVVELVVDVSRDAAYRTRHFVQEALQGAPGAVIDDAVLIVSELVTNATLHGRPPFRVRVRRSAAGIRLEVEDASPALPVIPVRSNEAMTGRGLQLVAAVSSTWGVEAGDGCKTVWAELSGEPQSGEPNPPTMDVHALLAAFPDLPDAEPTFTVRLGAVPTDLLLAAKSHLDNVVREATLARGATGNSPESPLDPLINTVTRDFSSARAEIKRQALAAAARGDAETELVLTQPLSASDAGERYLAALDQVDVLARHALTLTLEPPYLHKVFRRWYVQALVDQLRARADGIDVPPPRTFVQVLAAEVVEMSALRETAHRLELLQTVAAQLTEATTVEEIAAVVVDNASRALGALSGRVLLVDGDVLRSVAVRGGTHEWVQRYEQIPLASDLPGPVAVRTRRPLVLRNLAHIVERFPALSGVYDSERTLHVAPLVIGEHVLGVLTLSFPVTAHLAQEAQGSFVQALADALAQALERALALQAAQQAATGSPSVRLAPSGTAVGRSQPAAGIDYQRLFASIPTAYLVMSPDLVIVAVNDAYCATVGRDRDELVGQYVFDAFPPTADALDDSGVSRIQLSFERARDTRLPDTMPIQRYDIPDPTTGTMVERFWSLISIPVLGEDGRTALVVQRTEDITDYIRASAQADADRDQSEQWRRRAADAEADLFARARDLEASRGAEAEATRRFVALADVALHLAGAQTLDELVEVVVDRGMKALGADGGSVAVRRPGTDVLDLAITEGLGEQTRAAYSTLPLRGPMPTSQAAAGRRVLLPDADAALAWHPDMADVVAWTGCVAWAALPLRTAQEPVGALTIGWRTPQEFTVADLEVLEAMAAQCANALERVNARDAERAAAAAAVSMSEALQRSLLSEPPQPDDLEIVVRYRPAMEQAQVGGDWYDAFVTAAGITTLTVGDVAGHDRTAAAAMGQVRNLLRGIGYAINQPPALVLSTLDRSLRDLDVDTLATAVLAQIHQNEDQRAQGLRRFCWSNAGHLPPLLVEPGGRVRLLRTDADLLLGLDPATPRGSHDVTLVRGATLLLYTDGLVERRGASIDDGLAWLTDTVSELAHLGIPQLCDNLLARIGENEDDIALLALRTH